MEKEIKRGMVHFIRRMLYKKSWWKAEVYVSKKYTQKEKETEIYVSRILRRK
jgi:hypothetical protein